MAANKSNSNRQESHTRIDGEHDRRYDNNGQGAVKDPAHDGRLVENRQSGVSMQDTKEEDKPTSKASTSHKK